MLGPARTSEHRLGVLVRPALELGDRNEPELAPPDQPQLGLNVALERVQRHAERDRRLLTTERNTRDIAGRCTHGNLCLRYSNCYSDGSTERKRESLTEEERDAADPWLTLAEIAEELRVNPATVRQWVTKGQLKASRAGVRKWIVRRSELERMLAATRRRSGCHARASNGSAAMNPRSQRPEAPATDASSAIALYQIAGDSFEAAWAASASAPPSPGYLDRVRRFADACEHLASTMTNASKVAGVQWLGRLGLPRRALPLRVAAGRQPARVRASCGRTSTRRSSGWRSPLTGTEVARCRPRVPRGRGGDARGRRRARARRQLAGRIEGWMTASRSCARSSAKCFVERSTRPASAPAATGFGLARGA